MIRVMDMTTGLIESDGRVADIQSVPEAAASRADDRQADLPLYAGFCEYAAARPPYAGMPAEVAALDLEDFLFRMMDA